MAHVRLYLDTRRAKKDGQYSILIEVHHYKTFYISTGLSATSATWTGVEYNRDAPNYRARNIALRDMMNRVENVIFALEQAGKLWSTSDATLKKSVEVAAKGLKQEPKRFLDYLDEFIDRQTNEGTRTVYTTTKNKLLAYDPNCTLGSMDVKWLERFEKSMSATMKVNAYAIHLRNIRAVFNYALREGYTNEYPFRAFRIKHEATRKRSLTVEQLRQLRDYPCEDWQVKYRDAFMLMFYLIGINAADLFNALPSALENGRLEYKRAKTGKLYSVMVEPEAMAIIEKYRGERHLLSFCDEYSNYKDFLHRMGNALKTIGPVIGRAPGHGGRILRDPLFPDLSSYWSRHTWATIAAGLEVPIETISEALGHSYGCDTTSIYIAFDKRKVDKANRKVIDYVNGD